MKQRKGKEARREGGEGDADLLARGGWVGVLKGLSRGCVFSSLYQ